MAKKLKLKDRKKRFVSITAIIITLLIYVTSLSFLISSLFKLISLLFYSKVTLFQFFLIALTSGAILCVLIGLIFFCRASLETFAKSIIKKCERKPKPKKESVWDYYLGK